MIVDQQAMPTYSQRILEFVLIYVLFLVAGLWIGTALFATLHEPGSFFRVLRKIPGDSEWCWSVGIAILVILGSQVVFLLPFGVPRPPLASRGRPLMQCLLIATFLAGLLTVGALLALGELLASLLTWTFADNPWDELGPANMLDDEWAWVLLAGIVCVTWLVWGIGLFIYTRERWLDSAFGRIVGVLFAGTMIEWLALIPIDIMVRRRSDCYCATGTFWSVLIAGLGMFWLTGPAAFLLLTRGRRRAWRESRCHRCGYEKGPQPGLTCPECGVGWAVVPAGGTPAGDKSVDS
jgi:hypothetical protein